MRDLNPGDRVRIIGVYKNGEGDYKENFIGKHGTVICVVYDLRWYTGISIRTDGDSFKRIYPRESLRALPRR